MQLERERFVDLSDGTRLWTAQTGAGMPVVFCHGGPGLWDYLGDLAALLDDAHRVVRFDQRGCGRSSGSDGPFTLGQAVADLEQLRDALGCDRWAVLGHSWGAELALRYAAAYPDRVSGVVYLSGTGAGSSWRDPYVAERNRRLGAELQRWRQLSTLRRSPEEEKEWCLLQWRSDFSPAGDPEAHALALWDTRPHGTWLNQLANQQLTADSARHGLLQVADHVDAPVVLVHGADDPRPWTATTSLLDALSQAGRVVVDHAGHAPWTERPDAVRVAVLEVLAFR